MKHAPQTTNAAFKLRECYERYAEHARTHSMGARANGVRG